uniref:RNase H type-1 domain-containing protein n=1 Tax=Cannabis sativa TaxID=3483 RepID=A0A803P4X2_CANSA
MHSLSHRKSGRLGWMALKLDMAKAFDRVEWVFVRRVMEKFSFPQRFINLVMACVSTATFSFSINQQVFPLSFTSKLNSANPVDIHLELKFPEEPRLFLISSLLMIAFSLALLLLKLRLSSSKFFMIIALPLDSWLPTSFHSKLESMMAQFWWGGTEHNRKIHWKAWSSLCFSKFHGGLGFRSMKAFNQAMLAKQAWRLLQYPHSLVATLLKSRYFPHSSFLNSGKGHGPSLVWSRYGKLHYLRHHSDANMTVSDLLTPTKEWNHALLQATFPADVSQAILTISLTNISAPDAYYWSLTPHGTYTINSDAPLSRRNSWLHAGFSSSLAQVLHELTDYIDQYQSCNKKVSTIRQLQDVSLLSNGSVPSAPTYTLQLSVDAAQDTQLNKMGFGMSIQTNTWEVLLNLAMPWRGINTLLLMEAQALHFALSWCHAHSLYPDSIVSDCKVLVDYICNNDTHNLHLNTFVTEINSLLSYFPKAFISYIPRGANEAAHCLARKALGLDQEALWKSCSLQL